MHTIADKSEQLNNCRYFASLVVELNCADHNREKGVSLSCIPLKHLEMFFINNINNMPNQL